MKAALLTLALLAACSGARSTDYSCSAAPAGSIACGNAVDLAAKFAEAQGITPESATAKFVESYGVSEGHGVPAWIVAFPRPSSPYEVVLAASDGRVIAHTSG